MKLRELLWLLGMPKPAPRTFGHQVVAFDLPKDGRVEWAQWQHPRTGAFALHQETVDALRTFLRPGDAVIDIGAHTGDTTVPFALAVGPTGGVFAFEPNPYVFPVLERNAQLNRDRARIIPLPLAAAPQDGPITLEYGDETFCNGGRHEEYSRWRHASVFEVQAQAVRVEPYLHARDPALLERLRFIKVDAEGYDHFIIASLRDLVVRLRPFIRTEVFVLASRKQRLAHIQALRDLGYRVTRMRHDGDYPGVPLDDADVMNWKTFDVFCTPA